MKRHEYTSVLKDEMHSFLKMRESQGFKDGHRYILTSLDNNLTAQNVLKKELDAQTIDTWLAYACGSRSASTKNHYVGYYHSFAKFLHLAYDIDAFMPEFVRVCKSYLPYIFSKQEIERIFAVVDDIRLRSYVKSQAQFAVLLRIL